MYQGSEAQTTVNSSVCTLLLASEKYIQIQDAVWSLSLSFTFSKYPAWKVESGKSLNKVTLDHSYSLDSHHTQCSTHLLCHRGQRDLSQTLTDAPGTENTGASCSLQPTWENFTSLLLLPFTDSGRSSNTQKLATTEHLCLQPQITHTGTHTHTHTGWQKPMPVVLNPHYLRDSFFGKVFG